MANNYTQQFLIDTLHKKIYSFINENNSSITITKFINELKKELNNDLMKKVLTLDFNLLENKKNVIDNLQFFDFENFDLNYLTKEEQVQSLSNLLKRKGLSIHAIPKHFPKNSFKRFSFEDLQILEQEFKPHSHKINNFFLNLEYTFLKENQELLPIKLIEKILEVEIKVFDIASVNTHDYFKKYLFIMEKRYPTIQESSLSYFLDLGIKNIREPENLQQLAKTYFTQQSMREICENMIATKKINKKNFLNYWDYQVLEETLETKTSKTNKLKI